VKTQGVAGIGLARESLPQSDLRLRGMHCRRLPKIYKSENGPLQGDLNFASRTLAEGCGLAINHELFNVTTVTKQVRHKIKIAAYPSKSPAEDTGSFQFCLLRLNETDKLVAFKQRPKIMRHVV